MTVSRWIPITWSEIVVNISPWIPKIRTETGRDNESLHSCNTVTYNKVRNNSDSSSFASYNRGKRQTWNKSMESEIVVTVSPWNPLIRPETVVAVSPWIPIIRSETVVTARSETVVTTSPWIPIIWEIIVTVSSRNAINRLELREKLKSYKRKTCNQLVPKINVWVRDREEESRKFPLDSPCNFQWQNMSE